VHMSDSYVQALLHEREGYLKAGRKDRVRQVDAELARQGFAVDDVETAVDGAPETATARRPRGRPRKKSAG